MRVIPSFERPGTATLFLGVCLCLSAAGCQQPTQRYNAQLSQAHAALEAGETGRASRALAGAEQLAREYQLPRSQAQDLLSAEVDLQHGEVHQALSISEGVVASSAPDSLERARAEEIIGKGALRQAAYQAALEHFAVADSLYESAVDRQRMADLILLSSGLAAYSSGRVDDARAAWDQIADPRIRDSLDLTLGEMNAHVGLTPM